MDTSTTVEAAPSRTASAGCGVDSPFTETAVSVRAVPSANTAGSETATAEVSTVYCRAVLS